MTPRQLIDSSDAYLLARPSCTGYARQIRGRVRAFADWLGERDISAPLLNEFLSTIEASREPETVRGYRTALLAVLRFAGWIPDGPVRKVRLKRKEIDCFTLDELRQLIARAETIVGELPGGLPLAVFWPLAIDAGYSTGLRWGDLVAVPTRTVGDNGECQVTQAKTGGIVAVSFTAEAVRTIRAHGQERAVPWPFSYNHFRTEFRALTIAAGIRRGTWKMLRSSAGSHAELLRPGFGHRLLGNTRPIFERHYHAFGRVHPDAVRPPSWRLPWWRRILRWGA